MLILKLWREKYARTLGGWRARKQVILNTYWSAGGSSRRGYTLVPYLFRFLN